MKDITVADYKRAKRVWEIFFKKNLGWFHDLCAQHDILLVANVFVKFRNKCVETYGFDPACFLSVPGLAWQACLEKTAVKLELLTVIYMSLMIEKGIIGAICHAIYRPAIANDKCMKNYDKNKESLYIMYLDGNNLYGGKKITSQQFSMEKKYIKN